MSDSDYDEKDQAYQDLLNENDALLAGLDTARLENEQLREHLTQTEDQRLDEDWLIHRLLGAGTSWTDIRKLSGREREYLMEKATTMVAALEKV